MKKLIDSEDFMFFVNETFVAVNGRLFPRSSNLSANVFDVNVESNPSSSNALTQNVFSLLKIFIGSAFKCVTLYSLAIW